MIGMLVAWFAVRLQVGEDGQDLIEYALLGGLVALAILAAVGIVLTGYLGDMFAGIGRCIDFDPATSCW